MMAAETSAGAECSLIRRIYMALQQTFLTAFLKSALEHAPASLHLVGS